MTAVGRDWFEGPDMVHDMAGGAHRGSRARVTALVIVLVWVTLVVALGYVGYAETGQRVSDRLYHCLQLFVLDASHFPEPVNWELELARFLAPSFELVGLMLGIAAAVLWWTDWFRLLWLRFRRRKHVVICGIGRKGLQLVRDFRAKDVPVLVIDKERNNPLIEVCDQLGAVVLIGDATKSETLHKAYLHKAHFLIATCGDDGTNVEIAVRAEQLLARRKTALSRLQCYIHIVDLELRTLFRQHKILVTGSPRMEVTMFNVFENSARLLFRHHFLDYDTPITDENDRRQAHLVVFGFGQFGESVVLQAVKSSHLPNGKKLRVTIIDKDARRRHKRFLVRYGAFHDLCDAKLIQSQAESPAVLRRIEQWCADPESVVTLVVAFDNDSHSVSCGLNLLSRLRQYSCPILVRIGSDAGLAKLLADVKEHSDGMTHIQGFGRIEESCSANVVIDDSLNEFARMIHETFVEKRKKEGRSLDDPSMKAWQELDPDLKESNWQQAEHIPFKVRAINCDIAPSQEGPAVSGISDSRVDSIGDRDVAKIARMEHRRWFTERSLAGWKKGDTKDVGKRIHPDLKPWEELTEAVRQYDVDAVKLIPELLALDKKVIYRSKRG